MIRVRQVKVPIDDALQQKILPFLAKKLKIQEKEIVSYKIAKESIDARDKEKILFVYEMDVDTTKEKEILERKKNFDVEKLTEEVYRFPSSGEKEMKTRPIVVGSGPAGLFAAYLLAEHGYFPIVIERGEKVEDRVKTVNEFWKTGKLNEQSNVQFGEGGAGTFSDGKLNTLVKDSCFRSKKVFETFVSCGASPEILWKQKPHIGTDVLQSVVSQMREKIISMGGEFHYHTCLTDLDIRENTLERIEVNHDRWIPCHCLILAIGHSARDTFEMLYERKLAMEPKAFAIGVRLEHRQETIDRAQFGETYAKVLGPASYKLTYKTKEERGVYSFCMCPGGYVVNASSEKGRLAINGMSNSKRDSENANSAIVVTIRPEDFGSHPLSGLWYQRKLEEIAYQKGEGKIPIQLWKDFKNNETSLAFGRIHPQIKGQYTFANVREFLPSFVSQSLLEAISYFGKKIAGFDEEDVLVEGIESRTSSPVRLLRNNEGIANIKGIYPCGEGAGYAGGIVTAAIDGVKTAEKIATIYRKVDEKKASFFEI